MDKYKRRPDFYINELNPSRHLLEVKKLMKKYNQKTINVRYRDDPKTNPYITIPPNYDLIVRLKVWIAYDTGTDQLSISPNLIGVDNFWITQLISDHNNKRINLRSYIYGS